jgi:hypothetical protein
MEPVRREQRELVRIGKCQAECHQIAADCGAVSPTDPMLLRQVNEAVYEVLHRNSSGVTSLALLM